jgi:hypothetical protein
VDLKRLLATAAALLLAGCEIYAVPSPIPCPGERQGVLTFQGVLITPAGCPWASGQYQTSFSFPGSVSYGTDASNEAWICVDAPHAVPRTGTHDGDDLVVAYVTPLTVGNCTCPTDAIRAAGRCTCPPTSPLSSCSCPVILTETIGGHLEQMPGGDHFTGVQVATVDPPPDVDLSAGACDCQVSCSYSYTVDAISL